LILSQKQPGFEEAQAGLPLRRPDLLGLYVHFPYCVHKCSYCDFYSVGMDRTHGGVTSVPRDVLRDYEAALLGELELRRRQFASFDRINTVFFGGGTASLLPPDSIARILHTARQNFDFTEDAEITVEGNPESLTPDYIRSLSEAGVNRIHAGVQSLKPRILKTLDRYYDEERYAAIIETLRTSAISNCGADLMYGVPGQTREDFIEDLDRISGANVTHLSLYSLTVEQGTAYDLAVRKSSAAPPQEDLQADLFEWLPGALLERGFTQYEVSNYARGGLFSRHNLRYWMYEPTLAVGPGAHGFDGRMRYGNPRNTLVWQKGPADAGLSEHDPVLELPLCILRITLPLPFSFLQDLFESICGAESARRALLLMREWIAQGHAAEKAESFQWRTSGLSFLDDRVQQMQQALSQ
jgi:oxygen-independent coproporphyrinogen-3 oxidase